MWKLLLEFCGFNGFEGTKQFGREDGGNPRLAVKIPMEKLETVSLHDLEQAT